MIMEKISCLSNNDAILICSDAKCERHPFICMQQNCQCESNHQNCFTNIRWKQLKQKLSGRVLKQTPQLKQYLNNIDQTFKSVLKFVEISYSQFKTWSELLGLTQIQLSFYKKIKNSETNGFTGKYFNSLCQNLITPIKSIQSIKAAQQGFLRNKIETICLQLSKLIDKKSQIAVINKNVIAEEVTPFNSKIISNMDTFKTFFSPKNIKQIQLLYRASENNFQTAKFWEKCNLQKDTVTFVKTKSGKIVGGYTPLPWDKTKHDTYETDSSKQSFLFSITNNHKIPLVSHTSSAIRHFSTDGPTFGSGRDLWISNLANNNSNSYAYIGSAYKSTQYTGNQQSYKKFIGNSSGYSFSTEQWEVFKVYFE